MIFAQIGCRNRKTLVEFALESLKNCLLCPRACGVNRLSGERGFCRVLGEPIVSAHNLHFGEEPPISGKRGSGTVFFTSCTMSCIFCQNYPISQFRYGNNISIDELAELFLWLQNKGCHNINLVTPDSQIPFVIAALDIAVEKGLRIPIVANTSGYHSELAVDLMRSFVDIFLPDFKYFSDEHAHKLSGVRNYVKSTISAIDKMVASHGPLVVDNAGIAKFGVLIRHMVLPQNLSDTDKVLSYISQNWCGIPVSLMLQYFPAHKSLQHSILNRKLTLEESVEAIEMYRDLGLCGYVQRYASWPGAKVPVCVKEGA